MRRKTEVSIEQELSQLPLFADCRPNELRRLRTLGTRVRVGEGRRLVVAGRRGAEMVLVLSGEASCFVGGAEVARFGVGEFFGEVALLDGGPRTATVVARTDMEVLVLNRFEFEALIEVAPSIANRMLVSMAQRLRAANRLTLVAPV
ncbi:MAG TPA: cyclic nucleotide-binding domain-containing protein [Acidimicrobiales bacterium]|nr:cyclic nucleotide-binding domain-containing protein [Acidimicrobiales bacterium]